MFMLRRIVGDSMLPTLKEGQIVLIMKCIAPRAGVRIGDIIVVRHNGIEKIKRVTRLEIDKLFIVGDNKSHSTDSRHFGWLPVSSITGRILWPIHRRTRTPIQK